MKFPRLGPRSLAGQLMLVTALALLAAQAVNLGLLIRGAEGERMATVAAGAASQIADARDRLEAGLPFGLSSEPDFARESRRERTDDRGGMRGRRVVVDDQPRFRDDMTAWPELARRVDHFLRDAGIAMLAVEAARGAGPQRTDPVTGETRPTSVVAVAAQMNDGRWITVRSRFVGGAPRIGPMLAVQTGVLFALLLGPLLWVAWRVTRPLSRLSRAAAATRPGPAGEPVRESGPEDVRTLIRAFNAMRERIHAMLADKDRMLGAIGHDLRTPLASLRVRVEQVEDDTLRDRMAGTIEEMAGMLDDILSLARAGQPRETPEPTDLAALIGDTVADYRMMDRPVSLAPDGALAVRVVRPASLRRALRNLVDNAVAYGGAATIGLSETDEGHAVITVDDDGPGIPPHRVAELMEPFARAEESRNRNTGGSGLGLALARAIATAEGGDIELVNRPEGGLSARIILRGS